MATELGRAVEPYDTFCVSGGGVRATLVGLVVLHELEKPATPLLINTADKSAAQTRLSTSLSDAAAETIFRVPSECTYGLSGGAWCVLINEMVGAEKALQNAMDHLSPGNTVDEKSCCACKKKSKPAELGSSISISDKLKVLQSWRTYNAWQQDYVVNFIFTMVRSEFKDAPKAAAERAKLLSEKLHKEVRKSKVVIGVSITAQGRTRAARDRTCENILVCDSHFEGRVSLGSASDDIRLNLVNHAAGRSVIEKWCHFVKKLKSMISGYNLTKVELTRLHQATMSSAAFVALRTKLRELLGSSDIRGLPATLDWSEPEPEARHSGSGRDQPQQPQAMHATQPPAQPLMADIFDMGIRCNIPITADQLSSPGTSLVVDASNDEEGLFTSINAGRKWWRRDHCTDPCSSRCEKDCKTHCKKYCLKHCKKDCEKDCKKHSHLCGRTDSQSPCKLECPKHCSGDCGEAGHCCPKFDIQLLETLPVGLKWHGSTITTPLPQMLAHYVRFYRVLDGEKKPTGRHLICIALGRMALDDDLQSVADESQRLKNLTTFTGSFSAAEGHQPRNFNKEEFDVVNGEVRRFYRTVLRGLGLPHGSFAIPGPAPSSQGASRAHVHISSTSGAGPAEHGRIPFLLSSSPPTSTAQLVPKTTPYNCVESEV